MGLKIIGIGCLLIRRFDQLLGEYRANGDDVNSFVFVFKFFNKKYNNNSKNP
jgi:hypothetical protein